MNLFKLVKLVDKKISPFEIQSNLCTRVISPKSECKSCMNHCPTNSIEIGKEGIVMDDDCVECGICSTVCPTNAILWTRPSLNEVVTDISQKCQHNKEVYLHCEKVQASNAVTVSVPCLGVIPKEAWVSILQNGENLSIYFPNENCRDCLISDEVWRNELQQAEIMTEKEMKITSQIDDESPLDHDVSRRGFFQQLFSEAKSTNKLAVKEMMVQSEIGSYREKLETSPEAKVKQEWQEMSGLVFEKLTNESVHPYMRKRKIFIQELTKYESLRKQQGTRLPTIMPECDFCGACSILCPTNALQQEEVDGVKTISLTPYNCVDCHLCEEVCFSKTIQLKRQPNIELLKDTKVLVVQ